MASTTRQALLQALSATEGAYISGQQLAQQLGVSRAAVHKAAAALTAQDRKSTRLNSSHSRKSRMPSSA